MMIEGGEKRHYTAIKNVSRLLSKLNRKTRRAYHFCMNCFNGFGQSQQEISIMSIAVATSRLIFPLKKKNC